MPHYRVSLSGPSIRGARVAGPLLRDVLDVLVEGARRALRLRVEGRSTARGAPPAWLPAGASFDVLALEEGSTVVEIDAPPLGQALAAVLPQHALFEELDGSRTAVDLLVDGLEDVIQERVDSDRYDVGLLETLERLDRIFDSGVTTLHIAGGDRPRDMSIRPESVENIKRLRQETPPAQYVRVAGRLNVIRHSDRMFALILESGVTLRGTAEGIPPERLAAFFGRDVVVSGTATFRPSGRVQTIAAEQIEPAEGDVSVWAEEPRPLFADLPRRELYREQGPRSGINALIGAWPGEETDEELERLLEELS